MSKGHYIPIKRISDGKIWVEGPFNFLKVRVFRKAAVDTVAHLATVGEAFKADSKEVALAQATQLFEEEG